MKIIIPMTGMSKRFKKDGIDLPKQFLKIKKKMIIEHILDMFPEEGDINFIVNEDEFQDKKLLDYYKKLSNYNIVKISYQETGPGGALLESKLLETEEPVLINYCDFSNIWSWEEFKLFINENNPDGVIPAYKGLHPHSIYGNNYAFLKNKKDQVLNIQEKKPFTSNKMNEYASTGTYYFKSGLTAKKYIEKTFELNKFINGEIYISTPYEEMIKDNLDIKLYKISHFFQWGTPEDYNEFVYNLNEINNIKEDKKIKLNNINLVIPAAGEGSRFKEKNYKKPKIYLEVDKSPLIIKIFNSFENQLGTRMLILDNDFDNEIFLNKEIEFKKIHQKTDGQADSALLLIESIDNDNPILIHSADCILDKSTEINIEEFDIVVYTKNNYRRAFSQQLNYGWVNSENGSIKNLSIKSSPETKESNVIIGSFLFKNRDLFKNLYEDTKKNASHSLEIHIDHMVETAIKNGLKVKEEYSEKSSMLGTPVEYELFNYMKKVDDYLVLK